MLRVLFHERILRYYISQVLGHPQEGHILGSMEPFKGANGQLGKIDSIIRNSLHEENLNNWLGKAISRNKLYDISYLSELLIKVGAEENDRYYQEFMMMLVDLINAVFYTKQNRKGIHFSKYKKLFKLIAEEIEADVNGTGGRLRYENGKLWFAIDDPVITQEVRK